MRFFKRTEPEPGGPIKIADDWQLSEGEYDGGYIVTRFNRGAKVIAGKPAYGIQIGVAVPLNQPNEHGLPGDVELGQLAAFEDDLDARLAGRAAFVGVITTGGMREFVLYTGSGDWIPGLHEELRSALPTHEVQMQAQTDPKWSVYRSFVK